ncbi:MAG TPA: hypothetical protein VG944_23290, partial [Fimbriimonas sp.]|nr:hypothetical protein [Fimbriimonas sp.]
RNPSGAASNRAKLAGVTFEPLDSYRDRFTLWTSSLKAEASLFMTVEFSESHMVFSLGADCPPNLRWVCSIWEHTVYELEKLAEGLRYVADGKLPESYEIPSKDKLIGPKVGLLQRSTSS